MSFDIFFIASLIGGVAFALSGFLVGVRKNLDVMGVFILFVWAMALGARTAFGLELSGFGTTLGVTLTILQAALGDLDLEQMQRGDVVFGTIIFLWLLFLGAILLVNLFLAVVSNVYSERVVESEEIWEEEVALLMSKRLESVVASGRRRRRDRALAGVRRRLTRGRVSSTADMIPLLDRSGGGGAAADDDDAERDSAGDNEHGCVPATQTGVRASLVSMPPLREDTIERHRDTGDMDIQALLRLVKQEGTAK